MGILQFALLRANSAPPVDSVPESWSATGVYEMMKPTLPEGISETDYEAIEAAVMETVRGRWFLAEFSRRSHIAEMRQMLDAVARLEQVVSSQAAPADPSIRLLVSRLKEVGAQLNGLAGDMRNAGVDEDFCAGVETQARALAGLLRLNAPPEPTSRPKAQRSEPQAIAATPVAAYAPEPAHMHSAQVLALPAKPELSAARNFADRMAALAALDEMPILEKLRLFA